MRRDVPLVRLATLGLAFAHTFPAKKHLALFFAHPSVGDAWRGFGALAAIALYLSPPRVQARLLGALWTRHRSVLRVAGVTLAAAHGGAALECLGRLRESVTWSDAWRAAGASIAVVWFLLDVRVQAWALAHARRHMSVAASPVGGGGAASVVVPASTGGGVPVSAVAASGSVAAPASVVVAPPAS